MLRSDYESFKQQGIDLSDSESTSVVRVDPSLLKSLDLNEEEFQKVFGGLCQHWWNSASSIPDCEGKRFVQSALLKDLTNPVKLAIIADDLEVFKKYF